MSSIGDPFSIISNNCLGMTLQPGYSCAIETKYSPVTLGSHVGSFTITSDDPYAPTITLGLNGTGVSPVISLWLVTPNGGDSWDYSPYPSGRREHLVVWEHEYYLDLTRAKISYTTNADASMPDWTCMVDSYYKNYTSNGSVAIPDDAPGGITSDIAISDNLTINDVNVKVNITHPRVSDLTLFLIGPDNTTVVLSDQTGVSGADYTGTIFNDQAAGTIDSGTAPYTGFFKPDQVLSALNGKSTAGTWRLKAVDGVTGETGTINSWTINFSDCNNQNITGNDTLLPGSGSFKWEMPTQYEASAMNGQDLPSATCRIKIELEGEGGQTKDDTGDANFYIIQPTTTSIKTMVLWDSERVCERYDQIPPDPACNCAEAATDPDCNFTFSLSNKLIELKDHSKVIGVVLDLASVPAIQSAYAAWDAAPTDQAKANDAANAIRSYLLDQANNTYMNTQYVILVGDDRQIPFHRIADGTVIYPESNYPAEVGLGTGTTVGSALAQGYFLTDNPYGELTPEPSGLPSPHDWIYLNDFAVGRLVETPAQIEGTINMFIAQNGQVNSLPDTINTPKENRILVTGLDFLHDSAAIIGQFYEVAGFTDAQDLDKLIDDPDPEQTGDEFTPAQLAVQLFPTLPAKIHRVANINTHANHYAYAASIAGTGSQTLLCTDPSYDATHCHSAGMDGISATLTSSVLYTSGCHSGLTVPETDAKALDLPEEMAKKGVVAYVANTGYGWGIKNGRGLTETLMENITTELLVAKSIPIGKALAQAKRSYVLKEKRWDVFDEKVMHELTLFGVPNYLVVTGDTGAVEPPKEELPLPDGPDQGCADGICLTKTLSTNNGILPPGMTELALNFEFGSGTYQQITTPDGAYYQLNGRSSGEVGDIIQPHFTYNSILSGTNAHGVIFTGGSYSSESPYDPVVAVPRSTNTDQGEGPLPSGSRFIPGVRASFGTAGGAGMRGIGQVGYTNMLVHTGFYESATQTESRFEDMQFVVYYSNSTDITAPLVADPGVGGHHILNGLTATFTAQATDGSGVYRVVVTYHDPRTSQWGSLGLINTTGNTWTGTLALKGSIEYYVQTVDNAGNVGMRSVTGGDMDGNNQPYGSTWSGPEIYAITLADTDSDGMPDAYEDQYACLNKTVPDANGDSDYDYLTNTQEFALDTNPCLGDTDGGGDNDGSESHNGRNPLLGTDDKHLTIFISKNGNEYDITWPAGSGDNGVIDGYYFVYRSDTPFFDPTDRINGTPIPDGTSQYIDTDPPCTTCYYNVWNYALNTPAPMVEAVAPSSGSAGITVSVLGDYFQSGAVVLFGAAPATNVVFISAQKLRCTVPAGLGTVDVTVRNPNGQEGTLTGGFQYQ
jgi:subtilisin-like proprotein convertase family protein